MMKTNTAQKTNSSERLTLVLGATGKTGRRIVEGLKKQHVPHRLGSRAATPPFDWNQPEGWEACLEGVDAVYLNYAPDLAIPGATDSILAFVELARKQGVRRLVLLSGRGETEAQACERIVQQSGLEWTIVRASWFFQNFSEGAFLDMVQSGTLALPATTVPEPFVDVDDIAEVALAALTEPGHAGELYEVTGPRLMTFAEAARELSAAIGREIALVPLSQEDFVEGVRASGAPREIVWLLDYLFSTVLDGRNTYVADGVQRALKRPPRDFAAYARAIAASGLWNRVA